jgi:hypothetical protein
MCSVYRRDKGWKVRKRSMSSVASGYGRKFEGSRAVVKRRCVTQLRESAGVEAWDRPRLCPAVPTSACSSSLGSVGALEASTLRVVSTSILPYQKIVYANWAANCLWALHL